MLLIKHICSRRLRTLNSLRHLEIFCWIRASQISSIADQFKASIGIGGGSVSSFFVMIWRKTWKRLYSVSGGWSTWTAVSVLQQSHVTVVWQGLSQQNILHIPIIILQYTTSTTSVFTSPGVKTDPLRSVISMDQQSVVVYLSLKCVNLGTSKAGSQVHHSMRPTNHCRWLMRFFSPLKKPHWNACFRNRWTDWRNLVWQLMAS
jgi:hypothetical protein